MLDLKANRIEQTVKLTSQTSYLLYTFFLDWPALRSLGLIIRYYRIPRVMIVFTTTTLRPNSLGFILPFQIFWGRYRARLIFCVLVLYTLLMQLRGHFLMPNLSALFHSRQQSHTFRHQ
jgi:hypothetical protein